MKKLAFLLSVVLSAFIIAGCGGPKTVSNQQMTLTLAYGEKTGQYTGEVDDNNLPNGKGSFTTQNNQGMKWTYDGEFKNGHFDGQGKTVWANGQEESGTYVNDRLNGQGKKILENKQTYEGRFENGLPMLESVPLNTDVNFAEWTYKVTGVTTQKTMGNTQANGMYLVVMIDATNGASTQRQPGGQQFFTLVDDKGNIYMSDDKAMLNHHLAKNSQGAWYLSKVGPNLSVSGVAIIFDVPENISGAKLLPRNGFGKVAPIALR